jgi:polygalacturonase
VPAVRRCWSCESTSCECTIFRANDYGAKGDGVAVDTRAIQAALDAAARVGGIVTFAPGTYLTGAVFVKSGTELHLDRGVTLRGVQTLDGYPMMPTRVAGIEMTWPAALVNIYSQHNASITGSGTIDGDGKVCKQYDARGLRWAADYDARRPRLIQIYESNHVTLAGPMLTRSGFWTVHICYSSDVRVDGVTIRNNIGGSRTQHGWHRHRFLKARARRARGYFGE